MIKPDFLSRYDEELVVNITSLIDVIFILLIFFMVSTQFKKVRFRSICREAKIRRRNTIRRKCLPLPPTPWSWTVIR